MNKIRAKHLTNWSNKNCKFQPNQRVRVKTFSPSEQVSKKIQARATQHGNVIGVSVARDGRIRGRTSGGRKREFTRYFVQFHDGYVAGLHSHYLDKVD